MKNERGIFSALLSGVISGVLVLGIIGRLAIASVAIGRGSSMNLSLRGVLEVIILGVIMGAIGGILLFIIKKMLWVNGLVSGIMIGLILFVFSVVFALLSGRIVLGMSLDQWVTMLIALTMFAIYGIFAAGLLNKFTRG